ncbi:MAG: DUF4296 domain-containing protein [Bacteroidota bacterium]|nr:DUF4296 domain-containing protein [Bacteroidota bacterium]
MKRVIVLASICTLLACSGDDQAPAGVIPVKNMQTIVWQLMQADEYVNMVLTKDTLKKSSTERIKRYQQIFALNKVSEAEFRSSYRYYLDHPDIAKVMFDSIVAVAQRQRSDLYKPKADTAVKRPADSSILRPPPIR